MWIKICIYILLALISLVITVPVNEREFRCSQTCKQSANLMSYEIGSTYVYDYESHTAINLTESGNTLNTFTYSPIQIKAVVEISVHSLCELSLQLSDVRLQFNSTLSNHRLIQQLQANSLNFGYDDGKVVAVCPSKHEQIWVLNVKKSILSALQISTNTIESETTVTETDISGECETVYKPKTNILDDTIEIEKVKSLEKCVQNAKSMSGVNILNALIVTHLDFSESSMKCLQVVKHKIINSVKCDEWQAFQSPALTTTDLITNLSLSFKSREKKTGLESLSRNVISDDLSLTTKDLTDSNEYTTNTFNDDHTNRIQTLYKMSTINFFLKPTKSEVQFLIPLLHSSKTTNQDTLLISSVIAKYCEHRDNCDQIDMISATIDHLLDKLHVTSKPNEKLYIIKAIENLNITTHQTAKAILINLFENQLNSDEVRVASMNALRNCMSHTISDMLMRIYGDRTESSEMRISAYKLIVTSRFASDRNWYEFSRETDQNVANYMRTHVKNLRKMSDNNILPENMSDFAETDSNTFITSSNYDFKYSGVDINLDTIFANSSIIPKKVTIKTSLPLFGKNQLQEIEITVRQKGFDNYLKHILSETSVRLPSIYKELIELFANKNLNPDMKNNYLQIMIKLDGKNIFIFDSRSLDVTTHSIETYIKKSLKILVESLSSNKELTLNVFKHRIQMPTITGIALNVDLNGSIRVGVTEKNRRNTRLFKTELKVETYLENGINHKSGLESKVDSEVSFDLTNIELSFKRVVQNIQSLTTSDANAIINDFQLETHKFISKIQITSPNMDKSLTEIQLQTPWKNISIAASMDNQKAIRFDIKDNGMKEISLSLSVNSGKQSDRHIRSADNQNSNEASISFQLKIYSFETDIGIQFDQTNKNASLNVDYKIDDNSDKESIKLLCSYERYEHQILNRNYQLLSLEFASTQFGINYRLRNNISINSYELIVDDLVDTTRSSRVWLFADINDDKTLSNYLIATFSGSLFENLPHYKRFRYISIILTPDQNNITARIITPFRILRGILTVNEESDECFSEIRRVMLTLDDITSDSRNERLLSTVVRLSSVRLFNIESNYKWREAVENVKLGYKLCSKTSNESVNNIANTSIESTQFPNMNAKLMYNQLSTFETQNDSLQTYFLNEILIAWKNGFKDKIHFLKTVESSVLYYTFYDLKENLTLIATPFDTHTEVIEIVRSDRHNDSTANVVASVTKSDKTGRYSNGDYAVSISARIDYDNNEEPIGGSLNATVKYLGRDIRIILTADQNNITARIITPFRILRCILTVNVESDECFSEIRRVMLTLDDITSDSRDERLLSTVVRLSTDRKLFDIDTNYKWRESVENVKLGYKVCSKLSIELINFIGNTSIESTQFPNMNAKLMYNLLYTLGIQNVSLQTSVRNEILIAWKNGFKDKIHFLQTVERSNNLIAQSFDYFLKENLTLIATPFDTHTEVIEIVRIKNLDAINVVASLTKSDKTGRHSHLDYTVSFAMRIDVNNNNEKIGGSTNYTAKYWGRDMEYREKWQQFGDNQIDGKTYIQWQTDRYANIAYTIDIKNQINENKTDVKLKYKKWDETETYNIFGTITRKKSYGKHITSINFQSDSGQILKCIVKTDQSSLNRLMITDDLTLDLSYSSIDDISVKIAGKRSWKFGKGSNLLEINYKLPNTGNEVIKFSSETSIDSNKLSKSDDIPPNNKRVTQVIKRVTADLLVTQWSKYNHHIYYNSVYLSDDTLFNQELMHFCDSDRTLLLMYGKNNTIIDNKDEISDTKLRIEVYPYDIHYEIVSQNKLLVKQEDEIVVFKRDLIVKELKTGSKSQLSMHGNFVYKFSMRGNSSVSGYYFVELNCPKTNSSHITNISVDYDESNDYLNDFSVDSRTVNTKTNKTSIVKLKVTEDDTFLLLLFPDFHLILSESANNAILKEMIVMVGRTNLMPFKHNTELEINKALNTITDNLRKYEFASIEQFASNSSLFVINDRKDVFLSLRFSNFDLKWLETERSTTFVFDGKNNLLPYKHTTVLEFNEAMDTITANSKTYEIVNEEYFNDISVSNGLKLMTECNIEYEFEKRGVLEFVAFDRYKHRTEIGFEDWPAIALHSSMHNMSDNIYDVQSSLSNDLILDVNASMPSTKLEFELNAKQRTAKLFINDQ